MSELPDVITENHDNSFVLIANKKARSFLRKRFVRAPQWMKITNPGDLTPEYRALKFEHTPAFPIILCDLHKAGFAVMFECEECKFLHPLSDKTAERFMQEAIAIATTATVPVARNSAMRGHIPRPAELRGELHRLQARYDDGAIPVAIFLVVRSIEIELGWAQHHQDMALNAT